MIVREPGSSERNVDEGESLVMKKVQVCVVLVTDFPTDDKDQSEDGQSATKEWIDALR